jgi:glycosyltransferase involved in cell wall biosynthesis
VKISVVTPSYNQAHFLEQCLRSVHEQEGDFEIEHLVIDGGSTDGTVELLEEWKSKLWYVSEPDRGQSHAINKGIKKATGDLIVWLNSDDFLLPGALKALVSYFRENPDKRWAYGRCLSVDTQGRPNRQKLYGFKNLIQKRYSYPKLLLGNYISQPATFFKREIFETVGGLNENLDYAMDYDLWLRFGLMSDAGTIDREMAAFRYYDECKTGGAKETSLQEANSLSRKYARLAGKTWIGGLNYLLYYKLNGLVNKMIGRMKKGEA